MRPRQSGFTLLEMTVVLGISVLSGSLAMTVMSTALTVQRVEVVQSSMLQIKSAIRRYCLDTGILLPTLPDLLAANDVPDWRGPYLETTADAAAQDSSLPLDPWGHSFLWVVTSTRTGTIVCTGQNGRLDSVGSADADDLVTPVDLTDILRDRSLQELEELNLAVESYNTVHLPDDPLPADIEQLVSRLIANGLLQGTVTAWATDAFGAYYVPGPAPVRDVKCVGLGWESGE